MKNIVKNCLPLAKNFLVEKYAHDIEPGDMILIHNEDFIGTNIFEIVTVPKGGVSITQAGCIVVEGLHTANLRTVLESIFSRHMFFGLLNFDSNEHDNFIDFFSECIFKNTFISHLFKNPNGKLMVLQNKEELVKKLKETGRI